MSQPFDFMSNGTTPDDSDSTNPFLNFGGDEPEEDQQPEVLTPPPNDVDFLSRLSVKNVSRLRMLQPLIAASILGAGVATLDFGIGVMGS